MDVFEVPESLTPILGETVWHSITNDPTIDEVSDRHLATVLQVMRQHGEGSALATVAAVHGQAFPGSAPRTPQVRILEVAAYAHTTGYQLAQNPNVETTLFDISRHTLALGHKISREKGYDDSRVRRVSGDFHDMPFQTASFDFVFICSALHHTRNWRDVIKEMMRVLTPNGLLFLENEPCLRQMCFYKFETNRVGSLTPIESALSEQGVLRTVAQPYLGSRPEMLFGMIENQKIPLDDLIEAVSSEGRILDLAVCPEICMEDLEHTLVGMRGSNPAVIETFLITELTRRIEQARAAGKAAMPPFVQLPSDAEIRDFAAKTAPEVNRLPADGGDPEFRKQMARLFGASVAIVARKHGAGGRMGGDALRYQQGTQDEVTVALPPTLAALLMHAKPLLPDIATASGSELVRAFPSHHWASGIGPNGGPYLTPTAVSADIWCEFTGELSRVLVLLRVYVGFTGQPYRLQLAQRGKPLQGFDVTQAETLLFRFMIPVGEGPVVLTLSQQRVDGSPSPEIFPVVLSAAHVLGFAD